LKNDLSNTFSVIEIECLDRPGLLSEITGILADFDLDIGSAHVATFGEKVHDSFYVRDLAGQKIVAPAHIVKIEKTLMAIMKSAPAKRSLAKKPAGLAKLDVG